MSEYLPTGAEAHRRFDHAKRQAMMSGIRAALGGKPDDLLPFDDVQRKLGLHITRERGLQQVPLDAIVGSVGKYRDFTRSFWPKQEKLRERWKWIYVAAHSFHGLPPVDLYQVGAVYFVKDGNHRISVARSMSSKTVEAYVTEYISPVPLSLATIDSDLDALALQIEREDFLQQTRLLELRPEADLVVTQVGDYSRLQEHMAVPGYVVSQDEGRLVAWDEAVTMWYDDVYLPVVRMIRQGDLQQHYPGHTDADLYLWLMDGRAGLATAAESEKALAAAARQFIDKYSPQLSWVLEPRRQPGQWRQERVQPRASAQLFADILVTLEDTPESWQLVDHALSISRREHGRLHGLAGGQSVADHVEAGALLAAFAERCEAQAVAWKFREEISGGGHGSAVRLASQYANITGYDLVVVHQGLARTAWHEHLMASQVQAVIRRVSCPVLVFSQQKPKLSRALLAYDGSPYAEEALRVAGHLAQAWEIPLAVITVDESPRTSPATLETATSWLREQGIEARGYFKGGAVAGAILKMAEELASDLIILGNSGYSPFVELFVRSTVDSVLREATCSVLICS